MSELPETILQFGAGRFLRAFVDRFVQQANDAGQQVGRVVIVQSTAGERADQLRDNPAGYQVLVRGYELGELVERAEPVKSVARALTAATAWPAVLELATSPLLQFIVSNATEAGYVLDDGDLLTSTPPATLPGKLTQVLWTRFQAGGSPLVMLPCELIERNASKLLELVQTQAQRWDLPVAFVDWAANQCVWFNNLVDCIVTRAPAKHPLTAQDPLLISAEPYRLWAIEKSSNPNARLFSHPAIQMVDELAPFYLRKVRMLNGTHSAMTAKFLPAGFQTVQQVLEDRVAARWVRDLLFEEIVPTLAYRLSDVAAFADETYDRLRNPYLNHRLADIALNHADKVRVRLQPTVNEYEQLFRRLPNKLCEALAVPVTALK